MSNYTGTFNRIREAKFQNPNIKIVYEFPNEKSVSEFRNWLRNNQRYQGIIDGIRIRSER